MLLVAYFCAANSLHHLLSLSWVIFSHYIPTCSLSLLVLGLSFLHLLLSFDLITWFSASNRFTCLLSPCSLSPLSLSLPPSLPLSLSPCLSISIFELYPFIPYLLHPLQSSSVLHCGGRDRERESFSQVSCEQSAGGERRRSQLAGGASWDCGNLKTQSRRYQELQPLQRTRREGEFLTFMLLKFLQVLLLLLEKVWSVVLLCEILKKRSRRKDFGFSVRFEKQEVDLSFNLHHGDRWETWLLTEIFHTWPAVRHET